MDNVVTTPYQVCFRTLIRILALLIAFGFTWGLDLPGKTRFVAWTIFLLVYIGVEIFLEWRRGKDRIFVDPCVLTSMVTFGIVFGLSSFSRLGADNAFRALMTGPEEYFFWLGTAMSFVFLASVAMWLGYGSSVGYAAGNSLRNNSFLKKILSDTYRLRRNVVWFCIVAAVVSRYYQFSLGVYGYSSDVEQLYALAAYRQYLDIGASLGKLALVGLSLSCFSGEDKSPVTKYSIVIVTVIEILFGFLSGFKGQTIFPLIIVGVCRYIAKGKIPTTIIIVSIMFLFFAYIVIEPFRMIRYSEGSGRAFGMNETLSAMRNIVAESNMDKGIFAKSYLEAMISRSSMIDVAAASIKFMRETGLDEKSPSFLKNLLLSPFYAFIPRLFWESKPLSNIGLWFANVVWGFPTETTSVGMSPIGYLYFAGGWIAILIVFVIIGVTQRMFYVGFWNTGGGGALVYLVFLGNVAVVDSAVDGMFATILRMFVLSLVAQRMLFVR